MRPSAHHDDVTERLFRPRKRLEQVEVRMDADRGVIWGLMKPRGRPSFSVELLTELRAYIDGIMDPDSRIAARQSGVQIHYAVIGSDTPGVFSLGGDLALFRQAIISHDRETLRNYGELCIDNLYPWSQNCHLPLTTISLVQGDALGGGFECALASTVLVAEESSRMGFPEVLFNLFPGMGAYSFLLRKVGRRITEELLADGQIYTARQLYEMGIVDVLAPDGAGEAAVDGFIRKHSRSANGRRAIEKTRNAISPISRDELARVVDVWVDAALRLSERDIRMMDRLVRAQNKVIDSCEDDIAAFKQVATVTRLQRLT